LKSTSRNGPKTARCGIRRSLDCARTKKQRMWCVNARSPHQAHLRIATPQNHRTGPRQQSQREKLRPVAHAKPPHLKHLMQPTASPESNCPTPISYCTRKRGLLNASWHSITKALEISSFHTSSTGRSPYCGVRTVGTNSAFIKSTPITVSQRP